jgi:hypothetical protein
MSCSLILKKPGVRSQTNRPSKKHNRFDRLFFASGEMKAIFPAGVQRIE